MKVGQQTMVIAAALVLSSLVNFVDAFATSASTASASLHDFQQRGSFAEEPQTTKHSTSALFLQESSADDTDNTTELAAQSVDDDGEPYESTVVRDTTKKLFKPVGKALLYGSSYFFNALGLYFAFGLVLNLTGYAYEFSFRGGYKIETIEQRRTRNQFEEASKQYEREALTSNYKTPSQLAVEAVAAADENPN